MRSSAEGQVRDLDNGLLIIEVKGGQIRRDGTGRWSPGEHQLNPPPFEQAERSKHALREKLASLPDWPGNPDDVRIGPAVAFPDVSVRGGPRAIGLGPDAPLELVIDQSDLTSVEDARQAVDRAYDYWLGDRRRGSPLSPRHLESLYLMLTDPNDDVLYVFHDPEQTLYRDDVVDTLGLPGY
ncbi:MAG: nuclease-related domain-containing protein [Chloroflexota bacterium]